MSDHPNVAIFWDYENCNPPSNPCGLGYDIVNNIARIARLFGSVSIFRAYLDVSTQSSKSVALRSELQSSGVSIIDCPHSGKKDVVDKMILVDMLVFAIDHPAPATVILITGDRDYAYAVSTLRLRKYQVVLVVPSSPHISPSLESQASLVIDWGIAALRTRTEAVNPMQAIRQPCIDLDAGITIKLMRELQDLSPGDLDTTPHPYSATFQNASRLRRMSVRDLLEPSRHSKNTGSLDSMQELTHNPASPRKSTGTASDSALGGLPIPKTPSRSRRESISTGSTRARSATIVAQSPPAVEQDIPAKHPPPSVLWRSSISDIIDITCPAKHSQPVLPSLDALELPLHDNRPPSSIVVRLPLEPVRPTGDTPAPGTLAAPLSHELNCLTPPLVMTNTPTGLEPIPKPTSPIVAPMKTVTKTVTAAYEIPRIHDIGDPNDVEYLTGLRIEDNDGSSGWSITQRVRSLEGARGGINTPQSNHHSHVTSHTTYSHSPLDGSVGQHPSDTPPSKHGSPAEILLGGADDVDSAQFAAFPHALNTPNQPVMDLEPVLSSTGVPSTPFTTTNSHETDECKRRQMWKMFKPLIHLLLAAHEEGIARPSRSTVALDLVQSDKQVYQRVGASRFRDYTTLAEKAGIIELGGKEGGAWIALHPDWFRVDGITTTHSLSNNAPSPASDSSKTVQNPLLTGSRTLLIEEAAIFQAPMFASPERRSCESGGALPTSPSDRQDSASRASIPVRFQPLMDILTRMRTEGSHETPRSLIGQSLGQDVYARAGVSGFKEYITQASEAQLVQVGGAGGHAWIRLHPELRV